MCWQIIDDVETVSPQYFIDREIDPKTQSATDQGPDADRVADQSADASAPGKRTASGMNNVAFMSEGGVPIASANATTTAAAATNEAGETGEAAASALAAPQTLSGATGGSGASVVAPVPLEPDALQPPSDLLAHFTDAERSTYMSVFHATAKRCGSGTPNGDAFQCGCGAKPPHYLRLSRVTAAVRVTDPALSTKMRRLGSNQASAAILACHGIQTRQSAWGGKSSKHHGLGGRAEQNSAVFGFVVCSECGDEMQGISRGVARSPVVGAGGLDGGESIAASSAFGRRKRRLLELYSGTGSVGKVARAKMWAVESVDNSPKAKPTHCVDVCEWDYRSIDVPDVIWASPDCTTYTLAATWCKHRDPKTATAWSEKARKGDRVLRRTLEIIDHFSGLNPDLKFIIENPLGYMRRMPEMQRFRRVTTAYNQFGYPICKPTDFWTNFELQLPPVKLGESKCVVGKGAWWKHVSPVHDAPDQATILGTIPPRLVDTILLQAESCQLPLV